VADSLTLCAPLYGNPLEKLAVYNQRIAEAFYA
jgi:hypothetical protein